MQNRLDAAKEAEKIHQKQIADMEENMKTEHAARIESVSIPRFDARGLSTECAIQAERTSSLAKLSALKQQAAELETELQAYGASDPTKVEEKKRAITLAKEAAVRWTGEPSIELDVSHDGGCPSRLLLLLRRQLQHPASTLHETKRRRGRGSP